MDYETVTRVLTFEPGQARVCFLVSLLVDCIVEQLEEFRLILSEISGANPKTERIKVDHGDAVVIIADNQCRCSYRTAVTVGL